MNERDRLTVVIFGSTGNLTGEKLLPALESLLSEPVIGPSPTIVAVGRRELDDAAYYGLMSGQLKTGRLRERIRYFRASVEAEDGLKDLGRFLSENGLDRGKLIFYCATPPRFFGTLADQLHRYGLAREEEGGPFRRVVFEKPLGEDARSAAALIDAIYRNFRREQVVLIDHYLGKEAIQNLLVLRFFNNLYSTLRAKLVSDIQITVSEAEGIGDRGQYYDGAGVIKDMLQNHILQVIAFLTMERPLENTVADILENKLQAIHSVRYPTPLAPAIVIGQYQGYREEKYVRPDSRTPTYVAMRLFVAAGPLRGVPIFVRTGKALGRKHARIVIQLKPVISPVNAAVLPGNRIIVTIQPDAWIMLFFNHKIPGLTMDVKEVGQFFFREEAFVESPREGYQRLFSEIILGHRLLFPRPEEVIASWDFADRLLARIEEEGIAMVSYPRGVADLPESQAMLRRHGFEWYETWHEKGS